VALFGRAAGQGDGIRLIQLDLLIIQVDGLHIGNDRCWSSPSASAATAIKHRPAVVQALIDNLIERGLDPTVSSMVPGAEQSHPPHLRSPHGEPAVPTP
jgi:hypothetical protein